MVYLYNLTKKKKCHHDLKNCSELISKLDQLVVRDANLAQEKISKALQSKSKKVTKLKKTSKIMTF